MNNPAGGGVTNNGSGTALPVGVAAGSVCASNGVGQPCVYQSKPEIDVRDYGVVGNGIVDDTTAMQSAINAACPSSTHFSGTLIGGLFPFVVKITSTLNISKCFGLTLDFGASQGQGTPAIAGNGGFYWAGASGGTMLSINQTRDSEFKNFFLDCASTCNIPLLIDESGSVTTITTNDHFQDIAIRNDSSNSNFVGVSICPSAPGNCEAINFDRLWVNCSGGAPTATNSGTGLQYIGGQPFYEYVHGFFTSGCSIGAAVYVGNIVSFDGGLANQDYTDFLVDGGRNVYYRHFRSENGIAQIVLGNGSSFPGNDALIEENSFSGLTNNTTTISYGGSNTGGLIRIIRNEWDSNSTITPFGPAPSSSGAFVGHLFTEFNNFPNATNCPLVTGSNHVAEYVSILNLSFGTPACPGGFAIGGYFTSPQIISTTLSGTAPLVVSSSTPVANLTASNHPTLDDCGSTATCAAVRKTSAVIVQGSVAFPTATTVTITSLPFSNFNSYSCTASDTTTAAGVINATTYTSGSSVTFTETNGVNTDTIRYICAGF